MMTEATIRSRRGVALLLVLAALVLVVTVFAGTASIASIRHSQHRTAESVRLADELLPAAERAIQHWLEHRSPTIVLPEDAAEPVVPVLNDRWSIEGRDFTLRITAWDQCGMAPLERTRRGSIIRSVIPSDLLQVIDETGPHEKSHPGLDQFIDPGRSSQRAFPQAPEDQPATFGAIGRVDELTHPRSISDHTPAIGALIATHNRAPHRININTAPQPLIERALHASGRGGIESIIASRRDGKAAPNPPVLTGNAAITAGTGAIQFVGSSDVWSFRIDAVVDEIERSWWVVYERTARPRRDEPPWYCAQRLLITEP